MNRLAWVQVVIGFGGCIVGLLLIVASNTSLFDAYFESLSTAFWGGAPIPPEVREMANWLLATCGAGVVGWGIAWIAIAHIPLRRGESWAWWCLLVSLVVWVALDIAIALWFGVSGEIVFALCTLVAVITPLVISARYYVGEGDGSVS